MTDFICGLIIFLNGLYIGFQHGRAWELKDDAHSSKAKGGQVK